ncbi:MAG: deoxyribodipyrimidine photo-lyase [Glaciecola sp.]|jgi:deoxyribodipyrimidine photo-lyase
MVKLTGNMPNIDSVTVMWFKRDLRLRDNAALKIAREQVSPLALIYIVEPIMIDDPHMDIRHWRFIYQSIKDLNEQLAEFNTSITILFGNAVEVLSKLNERCRIAHIVSHEEVGLEHTYARDKEVLAWCRTNEVKWIEVGQGAVYRPLNNRRNWPKLWNNRILTATNHPELSSVNWVVGLNDKIERNYIFSFPDTWQVIDENMQLGGEKRAWYTLKHFFKERGKAYFGNIGDPTVSRKTCSRLSPYLAWGNISLKQVYQFSLSQSDRKGWGRSISAFQSRLHWHCHFIQKFETEAAMEFRPINKAYLDFPYCAGAEGAARLLAWKSGCTGVPIVDACMRAVVKTGYINFRMRAMVVSFLCHHLNVDWRKGASFLAAQFLDFEPGIHYPQFQMQAGVTGINTLRIYNPVKQSIDKDLEGIFIKKWLPQLAALPNPLVHQPWVMTSMEEAMYDFNCAEDYYNPIVDVEKAASEARDRMWSYKNSSAVKKEASRILKIHTT